MLRRMICTGLFLLLTACGGAQDPISLGQGGDLSSTLDAAEEDGWGGDELREHEDLVPGEDSIPMKDTSPGEDTILGEDLQGDNGCQPDCEAKECGPDGCGGSCGSCGDGFLCLADGTCDETPDECEECAGFECGSVGECSCGECEEGMKCLGHQCVPECTPNCNNKECGDDGCGGSCGVCMDDEECWGWICMGICEPQCGGNDCGPDGCGGSCGTCGGGEICVGGMCQQDCVPDCTGKDCGWDGCGGSCGACPGGQWCDPGTWTCETGACQLPIIFEPAQRANELAVGAGGHPGEALDVDQDPGTCAPSGDCESGLDNKFWSLMTTLADMGGIEPEDLLQDMVDSGDLNLLFELRPQSDGGLHLGMFYGLEDDYSCNPVAQTCAFWVASDSYDQSTCLPLVLFDNAVLTDAGLTAGGPGYHFTLPVPMGLGDQPMILTVERAVLEASVALSAGGEIVGMNGVIGGAIPEQAFFDAVEAIPEDQLPIDKNMLLNLLGMLLGPDIDLNGDGDDDAVSVGLTFTTGPASIIGITSF